MLSKKKKKKEEEVYIDKCSSIIMQKMHTHTCYVNLWLRFQNLNGNNRNENIHPALQVLK